MHDAQIDELVGELTTLIFLHCDAGEMLTEHRCTAAGKCACCKTSKYAQAPWPCTTYKAAARARELVAASQAPQMRRAG